MLNNFDLLSPPITLFYLEKKTHTSKIGGLFVLLLLCLCSSYIIYILYLIIKHEKVTSIFYKKFIYDIGQYYLNSSSIYFFIQFHSIDNESFRYKYASKYVRTYTYYGNSDFNESNLDKIDHWVYDSCVEGVDNKDLDSNLFKNFDNFDSSACLKYYYNSKEKTYYSLGNKEFIWPYLAHGIAQKNNVFLHTSIQKCTNDSVINQLFSKCPSQEEIDEYTTKIVAIFLYLVDNQVDPTNYKKPIQKYIQSISAGMGSIHSFEETYIFYSPLKVKTLENSFFERYNDLESLYFDTNIKLSASNSKQYFKYTRFTHFIQNNVQIYERRYDDILELLSHLGGIIQCIFNIFYWINYFYNKYIIVSDTNKLFFSVIEKRTYSLNGEKIKKLNLNNNTHQLNNSSANDLILSKKSNTIIENIIKNNINDFTIIEEKSNSNDSNNMEIEEDKNKIINIKKKLIKDNKIKRRKSYIYSYLKSDNYKENKSFNNNSNNNSNNNIFITNRIKELHYHPTNKKIKNNVKEKRKTISFIPDKIEEDLNFSIDNNNILNNNLANQTIKISQLFINKMKFKKQYSFIDFIKSIFSSKINNINFLIKYRKSLLSEENVLKSHINHIVLEKRLSVDKHQNLDLKESNIII